MVEPQITPELVKKHNLTESEFARVKDILGREPNYTELGIFSVMWSEHCSYKNSRPLLKTFPTKSTRILVGAGEEMPGLSISATAWRSPLRSNPTITPAPSNRSRVPPPAWAESSATFSPWARVRFVPSTRSGLAQSPRKPAP